jgi:hypothetical protein
MKTKILLLVATAVSLVGLSACSNHNDPVVTDNEPVAVQFKASNVTATPTTRLASSGDQWANGDAIGVFMIKSDAVTNGVTNFEYRSTLVAGTTNATTGFLPNGTANTAYFPDDNSSVGFVAYYPWKTGQAYDGAYAVNVGGTQASQSTYDLLYASTAASYNRSTPSVPLPFTHKLVKLIITATSGAGDLDIGELTAVTIKGMNTKADFNLTDGTLGATNTAADITPTTITSPASATESTSAVDGVYEAILLPAASTTTSYTVEFTLDGNTYVWDKFSTDIPKLEAGKKYTYTLKINKTGVEAEGTITSWEVGGSDDSDAY